MKSTAKLNPEARVESCDLRDNSDPVLTGLFNESIYKTESMLDIAKEHHHIEIQILLENAVMNKNKENNPRLNVP